jgi:hypothetical protein
VVELLPSFKRPWFQSQYYTHTKQPYLMKRMINTKRQKRTQPPTLEKAEKMEGT